MINGWEALDRVRVTRKGKKPKCRRCGKEIFPGQMVYYLVKSSPNRRDMWMPFCCTECRLQQVLKWRQRSEAQQSLPL